jgi:hypothetical protein
MRRKYGEDSAGNKESLQSLSITNTRHVCVVSRKGTHVKSHRGNSRLWLNCYQLNHHKAASLISHYAMSKCLQEGFGKGRHGSVEPRGQLRWNI